MHDGHKEKKNDTTMSTLDSFSRKQKRFGVTDSACPVKAFPRDWCSGSHPVRQGFWSKGVRSSVFLWFPFFNCLVFHWSPRVVVVSTCACSLLLFPWGSLLLFPWGSFRPCSRSSLADCKLLKLLYYAFQYSFSTTKNKQDSHATRSNWAIVSLFDLDREEYWYWTIQYRTLNQ